MDGSINHTKHNFTLDLRVYYNKSPPEIATHPSAINSCWQTPPGILGAEQASPSSHHPPSLLLTQPPGSANHPQTVSEPPKRARSAAPRASRFPPCRAQSLRSSGGHGLPSGRGAGPGRSSHGWPPRHRPRREESSWSAALLLGGT